MPDRVRQIRRTGTFLIVHYKVTVVQTIDVILPILRLIYTQTP